MEVQLYSNRVIPFHDDATWICPWKIRLLVHHFSAALTNSHPCRVLAKRSIILKREESERSSLTPLAYRSMRQQTCVDVSSVALLPVVNRVKV